DGDVLDIALLLPRRFAQQKGAHAVEAPASRFDGGPHPFVPELHYQYLMERDVVAEERAAVAVVHRLPLLRQALLKSRDKGAIGARRDDPHRLALERAADEHGLLARGDVDVGHARAALGEDFDESLICETPERLGDREAGHPEPLADCVFLNELARREGQRDDRLADDVLYALRRSA